MTSGFASSVLAKAGTEASLELAAVKVLRSADLQPSILEFPVLCRGTAPVNTLHFLTDGAATDFFRVLSL